MGYSQTTRRAGLKTIGRRGTSLGEVIVAIGLMSVVTLCGSNLYTSANQAVKRSQHREVALRCASAQIEAYREMPYTSLPSISAGSSAVSVFFTPVQLLPRGVGTATLTRVDANGAASLLEADRRRLETTVSWNNSAGDRGSVVLTTLIGKR